MAKNQGKNQGTKPTDLGKNRTGVQMAPARAKEMLDNTAAVTADPRGALEIGMQRAELSQRAPPIGTMPLPGSLKGLAKTAMKAAQGEHAAVFLDKLGERLAFERTGVRLYDAVLAKMPASATREGTLGVEDLRQIRNEELAHFHLCKEAIEKMGGDPTAVTPCADVMGVASMGLLQVTTDPRTTLTQCLDALLTAELTDNDGWKILIAMAEALGQADLASRFTEALAAEDRHLRSIRAWVTERLELQLGAKMPAAEFGEPAHPA
jgi:rubrerythrin